MPAPQEDVMDDLSRLLDEVWPVCPACGLQLEDAGLDETHPYFVCPACSIGVVPRP